MNAVSKKRSLCQFPTPAETARFMAGLFPSNTGRSIRLLDAGAGTGSLSAAFLERIEANQLTFDSIHINAFELDKMLHQDLRTTIHRCAGTNPVSLKINGGDFIETAVRMLLAGESTSFTHAILNPPYRKIPPTTSTRQILGQVKIETPNFYSAFLALAISLMENGGHVVAILPRSFCNGSYHRKFRQFLLERTALKHIHLFTTRDRVFSKDSVLQEMVVIRLERGTTQGSVTVSTSTDADTNDIIANDYGFDRIVRTGDPEKVFYLPTGVEKKPTANNIDVPCTLSDLGLSVSTGPIMEFRFREHLCTPHDVDSSPLLCPTHCRDGQITWPSLNSRKPNAIKRNCHTQRHMYPNGWYCVVRRISSNDEARRLVATVVDPAKFHGANWVAIENHLNVFHANGRGLSKVEAKGLAAFLNSPCADCQFRQFSGSTQVNASDLKRMRYPDIQTLIGLGQSQTFTL